MTRDELLDTITEAMHARDAADATYEAAIVAAFDGGVSAYAIAKHTGMSASGVHFQLKKHGR